jgi:hypothetical protein
MRLFCSRCGFERGHNQAVCGTFQHVSEGLQLCRRRNGRVVGINPTIRPAQLCLRLFMHVCVEERQRSLSLLQKAATYAQQCSDETVLLQISFAG